MNRQQEQSLPPSNTEESQFSAQLPTRWGRKSRLFIIYTIASLGQYYHLVIIATLRQYCHLVYMGSDSSPGPPRPSWHPLSQDTIPDNITSLISSIPLLSTLFTPAILPIQLFSHTRTWSHSMHCCCSVMIFKPYMLAGTLNCFEVCA